MSYLKIVFVIDTDNIKVIKAIEEQVEKFDWLSNKDYIVIGDGRRQISKIIKEFGIIKGKVNKDTLFIIEGHGKNEEVKSPENKEAKEFHFIGDIPTKDIFNKLKIESGLPYIESLAFSCNIGGVVKRNEVNEGITVLVEGNNKGYSSTSQTIFSIEKVISLKASGRSNFQIFKYLVANKAQTFYFKEHNKEGVKVSRPIKFTFGDDKKGISEIEQIITDSYKDDKNQQKLIIDKLRAANKKNKKDLSFEGAQMLIKESNLSPQDIKIFLQNLRLAVTKKTQVKNIKEYLIKRSNELFPKIKLITESEQNFLMDIAQLELIRKEQSQSLLAILEQNKELVNKKDREGWTIFTFAVYQNRLEMAKMLIDKGAQINIQDNVGCTALMTAIDESYLKISEMLIEEGAQINIQDKKGSTALIRTIKTGNLEAAQMLINNQADVNIQDQMGWTALMFAAFQGNLPAVKILIEASANLNIRNSSYQTALDLAKTQAATSPIDYHEIISLLTMEMSKPPLSLQEQENKKDQRNNLALISASRAGNLRQVKMLIKNGININYQDKDGETALIFAANNEHLEVVQTLVDNKADVNIKDKKGNTALMVGAKKNLEITSILIDRKADLNAKNNQNITALIMASAQGNLEIAGMLINRKANLDIQDNTGSTALIYAVCNGHLQIVQLLIAARADVTIKDQNNQTALDLAKIEAATSPKNYQEIIALLSKTISESADTKEDKLKYKKNKESITDYAIPKTSPLAPAIDRKNKDKKNQEENEI